MDLQTCRYCHMSNFEDRRPMVRIGPRHNAHWQCKFDALKTQEAREAWLKSLPSWSISHAPFMLLQDYKLYDFVCSLREKRMLEASRG